MDPRGQHPQRHRGDHGRGAEAGQRRDLADRVLARERDGAAQRDQPDDESHHRPAEAERQGDGLRPGGLRGPATAGEDRHGGSLPSA
eukprot:Nk52_evm1s2098 gene=Nk52_evmTU1s2098